LQVRSLGPMPKGGKQGIALATSPPRTGAPLIAVCLIPRRAAVFLSRWIEISVVLPLSTSNSPSPFHFIASRICRQMTTLLTLNTIAKWPSPNYVDPVKHGPALLVVNVLFFSLMTIVLTLRLISKVVIKRSFGVDDILICVAWVYSSIVIRIPMVDLETDIHLRYTHRDHHWYGKVWLE
jgi:hypothetical protein